MNGIQLKEMSVSDRHQQAIDFAVEQVRKSEFASYVEDMILFGSCARKEARWDSDVDLLLVLKPEAAVLPDFSRKIHMLKGTISQDDLYAAETDLKVVVGNAWRESPMLFFQKIREEGISIWY